MVMSADAMAGPRRLADVSGTLREAGELAIRAAERSAEFRRDFASIARWWAGAHDDPERLLAIFYMRAQEHAAFGRAITGKDLEKRANRAHTILRSTERNALQNLVADLDIRIRRSMFLTRRLAAAQEELAELAPDMDEIARRLVPLLREHGVPSAELVTLVLLVILL